MEELERLLLLKSKEHMIMKQLNSIKLSNAGFIVNPCGNTIVNILVHSIENIDIFDIKERNNVNTYINTLNNGN